MSACDENKICKIILIDHIIFFLITAIHFIFIFLIYEPDFNNILDTYNSSPLFNFKTNNDCNTYSLVLHQWEGINGDEKEIKPDKDGIPQEHYVTIREDEIDIKKINGVCFDYKHIRYIDLLNNDQIIKKGTNCPDKYPKNCGVIDTLLQELCIETEQNCPLYNIGIGNNPNGNYLISQIGAINFWLSKMGSLI